MSQTEPLEKVDPSEDPVRTRSMTAKGKQYKLDVHFSESKRIQKRLTNQKLLIHDLLQSDNVEAVNRELARLDDIHQGLLEVYAQVREIIQVQGNEDESGEPRLSELVKVVDEEDNEVFQTKKSASEWLIKQTKEDVESVASKRSGRSRKSSASGSKRSRSGESHRTGSADSRASARSVRSAKSNCSNLSRTSKKAKLAGLKAEVEVLKTEGKLEINEIVKHMKLKAERYEQEQKEALMADIACKENAILMENPDLVRPSLYERSEHVDDLEEKAKVVSSSNEVEEQLKAERLKEERLREDIQREEMLKEKRLKDNRDREMRLREEMLREEKMKEEKLREKREEDEREKCVRDVIREGILREKGWRDKREKEEQERRAQASTLKDLQHDLEKLKKERIEAEDGRNILKSDNIFDRGATPKDHSTTSIMMEMLKLHSAPKVDIDVFSGDPLEYIYFVANFKDMVENVVADQRGRLNRLIQYTSGEAKELIRHCVHNDPLHCYDDALALLEREYGNPLRIACAYMDKLKNWPSVKHGDGSGYKDLYRFLLQCLAYQKSGCLDGLDSPLMIRNVQLKLPVQGQDKWAQIVGKIRKREKREAAFKDFVEFVESESLVLNDPVYSRSQRSDKKSEKDREIERLRALVTKDKDNTHHAPPSTAPPSKTKCQLCDANHCLNDCEQFMNMNLKERKQFIFSSRLCFTCLNSGHRAKDCQQKLTCGVCAKEHPTVLHVYKTMVVGANEAGSGMSIVPVRLHHKSNPDERILVYALLDECSQGTFMKEDILMRFPSVQKTITTIGTETLHGVQTIKSLSASGFSITCSARHESVNNVLAEVVDLPVLHSRSELPFDEGDVPSKKHLRKWEHLNRVTASLCEEGNQVPIGLLIGRNCPLSLEPVEVIPSREGGPYAYRTRVGWLVSDAIGTKSSTLGSTMKVNFNRCRWPAKDISTNRASKVCFSVLNNVKDLEVEQALKDVWNVETSERNSEKVSLSMEDRKFLEIMKNNIRMVDGHYELPLPFRDDDPKMPCNRKLAEKRMNSIRNRMLRDEQFHCEYSTFMKKFIDSGYARIAPSTKEAGWFLFHHAVFHPTKNKIRVVFDGSAEVDGVSLNNQLLQGPDLTNQMVGVFLRFRKENVPIIGDLESMYCQVRVPEHQRRYLRFLFWPNGDLSKELIVYEMCVHIFGAVSSMGCVNYALHKTADDNERTFGSEAAKTLKEDFYVDDMGTSVENDQKAIELIHNIDQMCSAGGFNLTKIMCSSSAVMETVSPLKRSESAKLFNLKGPSTVERPLGVLWTIENDSLGFNITFKSGALTRRGILATISSVYDLLGIASPFLLKGRKILQEITGEKVSWDADVEDRHVCAWNTWKEDLLLLNQLTFPRCYKPPNFGRVLDSSLHVFGDGCKVGYGAAAYLRQVNEDGKIAVSLVMGKSRVSPLKMITIPRLELTAATVAVKLGALVKESLKIENVRMVYYSDSKVTLGYIFNDIKRFRVFVANRHQMIRSYTKKEQWEHVDTKENPADDASRGLSMRHSDKVQRWLTGPEFLLKDMTGDSTVVEHDIVISEDDPEVIKVVNACSITPLNILQIFESRISRWVRMKRAMAAVLCFVKNLKERVKKNKDKVIKVTKECSKKLTTEELRRAENIVMDKVSVEDLAEAERTLFKMLQTSYFAQEMSELTKRDQQEKREGNQSVHETRRLAKRSLRRVYKLDPFLDEHGVMRVGGRVRNSDERDEVKHPVILPRKSQISKRIVENYHRSIHHGGRNCTINEIRSNGIWIVGISGIVRSLIYQCVGCRIQRGALGSQKMSDLPAERTSSEPPFTYCGVDMFGPFIVKEGRKELKRYCALFTCFSSRAVHIEVTSKMDTDSFIQALRRFVARRGAVRTIRSDNGGNFVGAENELRKAWQEMDHTKIANELRLSNCDWIQWERNVPVASHMGGVWERQIRTVRSVLSSMLKSDPRPLDHESFSTLMAEVEAIVNSRPLTIEDINDPESMPLTPNHLLTLKSKVILPLPGVFQNADLYCRKRWRAVQHLANVFWNRWRKEYLQSLQKRSKWTEKKRNFCVGDVVLLKDSENVRNNWPMGVVSKVFTGEDGLVRTVEVKTSSGSTMKRPIAKLVLLLESLDDAVLQQAESDEEPSSRGEC